LLLHGIRACYVASEGSSCLLKTRLPPARLKMVYNVHRGNVGNEMMRRLAFRRKTQLLVQRLSYSLAYLCQASLSTAPWWWWVISGWQLHIIAASGFISGWHIIRASGKKLFW